MNNIKVRPILVENKEITEIWSYKRRRLYYNQANFNDPDNVIYYQLILISLEDEKIEEGDKVLKNGLIFEVCDNKAYSYTSFIRAIYCNKYNIPKVIATQNQLSPELIQQLIDEYNNSGMEDFEIEMEGVIRLMSSDTAKNEGWTKVSNTNYTYRRCKLTNGFVTVVEKEPILYTEEEVKRLYDLSKTIIYSLSSMISSHELKNLSLEIAEFENWFNKNKKK